MTLNSGNKKPNSQLDVSEQLLENTIKRRNEEERISKIKEEDRLADTKYFKEVKGRGKKAAKETELDHQRAESRGLGADGSVRGKISAVWKGANNPEFAAKALSTGGQAAATMLKAAAGGSATLSNAMGLLTGAINPTTAAFGVLAWATEQAINAFVEGYKKMQEIQKETKYKTEFTSAEAGRLSGLFMNAAGKINDLTSPTGIETIVRITNTEAMATFQNVLSQFKGFIEMQTSDRQIFAELAVGLEEMGYNISGPIGEIMKTQYYRDNSSVKRTNELLNNLVGLSKSSTMSLDELVAIVGDTKEQNLNAWTLMRAGKSATEATALSTSYGTSKATVTAAADTLGLSKDGVEAIYGMINDIITSATDPTKLGDLTRKYQVGGMTGGKSITQIYDELAAGNFTKVFKDAVQSAANMANDKQGLGFEYLSSQFGSNISTVLGSFTPTVISKLFTTIDDMNSNISTEGKGSLIMSEIVNSIAATPITTENILNGIFNELTEIGAKVATFFAVVQNAFGWGKPKSTSDKELSAGDVLGAIFNVLTGKGSVTSDSTSTTTTGTNLLAPSTTGSAGSTLGSDGQNSGFTVSDYYANNSSGWFTNNDIKGTSPFKITAGFMAPAYKKQFGSDHTGVDYGAKTGTPITSPIDGKVTDVGYNSTSGNYVEVRDATGRTHRFQHMSRALVKPGDSVSVGMQLGTVGATGKATGPHVHYSVKQNGKFTNPNQWAGTSFGGLAAGYGGVGASDTGNGYNAVAKSNTEDTSYYSSTEIVNSINDLNGMLSTKLDIIISKMISNKGLNQFSYK